MTEGSRGPIWWHLAYTRRYLDGRGLLASSKARHPQGYSEGLYKDCPHVAFKGFVGFGKDSEPRCPKQKETKSGDEIHSKYSQGAWLRAASGGKFKERGVYMRAMEGL